MKWKILISMLFANIASADEPVMPDFVTPPQKYEYQHEIARAGDSLPDTVVDELYIGDVTAKELKFYFYLIGTNGHICGGSGIATFRDDSYYYDLPSVKEVYEQGKLRKERTECRLRVRFDSTKASLQDEDGNCKQSLCGMRGYIGDVKFQRVR